MTHLQDMYESFGVSPWLDTVSRELIRSGELKAYVDKGIRGVTSNPSIFEKAFQKGSLYEEPLRALRVTGMTTEEAYWELAIEDIREACHILKPVYDESGGNDGFVSLEVSPHFAYDAAASLKQAKELWQRVNQPNLMIKIPATKECLPVITDVLKAGINVNVTLIFSLHRYLQVINAYMQALEEMADPKSVRSVASFFVSRVDTLIDPDLKNQSLRGKAAVAQALSAYGIFLESFNEHAERWSKLRARGASAQRPLWASTSTKNPDYPDLKYVNSLLSRDSVNTLPDVTVSAILDHAQFHKNQTVDSGSIEQAHADLTELALNGVDMNNVALALEKEGVQKFQDAFTNMLHALEA